jgi:ATP-dependent RNA helicase DBP3
MLSDISAPEEPERKKKRKKTASEDSSSKKKKKRRKTEEHAPETQTTLGESSTSTSTPAAASEPSASEIEEYLLSNSITLTTAKAGPSVKPILSFDRLQIPPELKTALSGFQTPTPIQACSWPPALQGQDVVGIAETGRYGDISTLTYLGLRIIHV